MSLSLELLESVASGQLGVRAALNRATGRTVDKAGKPRATNRKGRETGAPVGRPRGQQELSAEDLIAEYDRLSSDHVLTDMEVARLCTLPRERETRKGTLVKRQILPREVTVCAKALREDTPAKRRRLRRLKRKARHVERIALSLSGCVLQSATCYPSAGNAGLIVSPPPCQVDTTPIVDTPAFPRVDVDARAYKARKRTQRANGRRLARHIALVRAGLVLIHLPAPQVKIVDNLPQLRAPQDVRFPLSDKPMRRRWGAQLDRWGKTDKQIIALVQSGRMDPASAFAMAERRSATLN